MEILNNKEKQQILEYLQEKGLPTHIGVTFGDVTLNEHFSRIRSRSEISDFSTAISEKLKINIPFLSANMESVTGAELCIALEREGGLGMVPQTVPIEERLAMIEKVKRSDAAFIDNPLYVDEKATLEDAKKIMDSYGIYSLIVVNKKVEPVGILSTRDWRYETNPNKKVTDLMSKGKVIKAEIGISVTKAKDILRKNKIEKLPLVNKKGVLVGLMTAHGLFYDRFYPNALRNEKGEFLTTGSIGVGMRFTPKHMKEVEMQVERGISALLIDTARAFSVNTSEALKAVKKRFPKLPVIIGNVSTPEGAKFLFENGADSVKVNQGRGHVCRTSEIGIGTPQLTAIALCSVIAKKYGGTIVADGGMKSAGDMVKALAAGADTLMSGYFFIGSKESSAMAYFNHDGIAVKNYEGSASFQSQAKRISKGNLDRLRRPEGVTEAVPVTGTVKEKLDEALDAFRSSFSYQGVKNIKELQKKAKFSLQTQAGLFEGTKK